MATITTTTASPVLQYPASTFIDRNPSDGSLWAMVRNSAGNFELWRSPDATTWSLIGSALVRANMQEWGGIYIWFDQLFWCYRVNEGGFDEIYSRTALLTPTSVTWDAECAVLGLGNSGTAGSVFTGIDCIAAPTSWGFTYIAVAGGLNVNGSLGVAIGGATMDQGTRVSTHNDSIITGGPTGGGFGGNVWLPKVGTGRQTPSIGFQHDNTDGKTANTPHLWVSFGRTEAYTLKLTWTPGLWSGPSTPSTDYTGLTAQNSITGRWDGTRWVRAVPDPASTSKVRMLQLNASNTSLTSVLTPTHPTGVVRNCSIIADAGNGNPRVLAVGTSTTVLYSIDYNRANSTWGAWTAVLATAVMGTNGDNWATRRDSYGNRRVDSITAQSGAPNTIIHTPSVLPYAPNTPVWTTAGLAYMDGGAADVAIALVLDWVFSDADPLDTQSAYAVSRQVGAGALAYWRASDSTWQPAEVQNTSGTTALTLAASWAAGTDANYVFKVKYWDSTSVASSYSGALTIIPSVVVNPAVTAPTAAQVLGVGTLIVTWTATEQTAYRITLATNPGGVSAYDSGWVTSTVRTLTVPNILANGTGWTVTLQTRNNEGLASAVQSVNFTVVYTPPATPTLVNTAVPASGWVSVAVTNPTPTGGQPAVTTQELYRRVVGDGTNGIRLVTGLASGATYQDWKAVSGVAYEYRVQVFGANSAAAYSAWTA